MPQIISVSRRTDIPAFYSEWFMNRIRSGFCTVANPYNLKQVSRVSLIPQDVLAFVFWTRDPEPLMPYLDEIDSKGYKYYFQYTLIGYPQQIDPGSPSVDHAIRAFQALSQKIGVERVIWRYDPVYFSELTPCSWHQDQFDFILDRLAGYTQKVIFSVIDPYRRTLERLSHAASQGEEVDMQSFEPSVYKDFARYIHEKSQRQGLTVSSCAEQGFMDIGMSPAQCIDDALIARMTGFWLKLKKDSSQRKACGCVSSKDIGANDTCLFGCPYCYATRSFDLARKNHARHDPLATSLSV